jgi:hypothetical protein
MKTYSQLLILCFIILFVSACSKDKEVTPANNLIVGKWLATNLKSKIVIYGTTQTSDTTLQNYNIIYEFKADNTFSGSASFLSLEEPTTNNSSTISGTYSISGNNLILLYTDLSTKKPRTETYNYTATNSVLALTITLDNFKKALADQLDSDTLAILNAVTTFDFTISFKKQ